MGPQTQNKSYKSTVNLPRTRFPMKAGLVQNEPVSLKRWQQMGLYRKIREARAGAPAYVFHDGPPYANGNIHLGHLLNKVLKDLVVRSKTMAGFDCPYVPGWDCHGQPIEHKVLQDLGERALGMEPLQVRRHCEADARKFIKLQSRQMQRLLTLADYEHPYITMHPAYEGAVLEVFADLVEKGLVYRDLKPVHWSVANQTALAEAELEYEDREDTSIYVLLEIEDGLKLPSMLGARDAGPVCLMIWTTTPWTLPANLAVAVAPAARYALFQFDHHGQTPRAVLAENLGDKVLAAGNAGDVTQLGACTGRQLADAGITYRHPFIDDAKHRPVVTDNYVSLEDGTGLVHTAPGHGEEDYKTAMAKGLEIYCPVKGDGTFDDTAPDWLRGVDVWEANDLIVQRLGDGGHLFYVHQFTHSYPHDWRSKTPTIFRATEQWFIDVDRNFEGGEASLRSMAMTQTANEVTFIPEWGRNRMRGMLESRPDWCLSRQRSWGLPIPAFFDAADSGRYLLTAASVRAVAAKVRRCGSDCWFTSDVADLLAEYDPATDPDAPDWLASAMGSQGPNLRPAQDIFDVWFESGSSWHAVMRQRGLGYPIDLYLEGSDQHRGWFQLSLLPALGVTGQSPFRNVLTHGFMVDKNGRKMSKSLGNTLEVENLLKEFGADVCRWWVSSLNTDNDIKVDHGFFKIAGDEYRKLRNTIRYLLGNLNDFDPHVHRYLFTDRDATSFDAWALGELVALVTQVRQAYDQLSFRKAHEALFNFCNDTMSAVYLAATKDRLYCDKPASSRRRRTQTAFHIIADALIRLLAPILPHTAEEAWGAFKGTDAQSVHLQLLPDPVDVPRSEAWPQVMRARDQWLKQIEEYRQEMDIDNPLHLGLQVAAASFSFVGFDPVDLADLCGISRFEIVEQDEPLVVLDLRGQPRCERSWKRDGTVKLRTDADGDQVMLSDRDAEAIGLSASSP